MLSGKKVQNLVLYLSLEYNYSTLLCDLLQLSPIFKNI